MIYPGMSLAALIFMQNCMEKGTFYEMVDVGKDVKLSDARKMT